MKKYGQDLLLVLGTALASGYVIFGEKLEGMFVESGNILIPLWGRLGFPLLWGLYWGIAAALLCRWRLRISPVSLLLLAVNLGIVWYLWETAYQLSAYHLMLLGGLAGILAAAAIGKIKSIKKSKN